MTQVTTWEFPRGRGTPFKAVVRPEASPPQEEAGHQITVGIVSLEHRRDASDTGLQMALATAGTQMSLKPQLHFSDRSVVLCPDRQSFSRSFLAAECKRLLHASAFTSDGLFTVCRVWGT